MPALIFLSHIHEESDLAKKIQDVIEAEFAGFVDVFVSSDKKTIAAGVNFLKRIEDGLVNCVGAIYLISPISVKRNWVNFELGAVWVRNVISTKNRNAEIPTIPFCHSGITPSMLPMPLINLSAVQANNPSQLEAAFRSIQDAVGGKGKLKTNFDNLAQEVLQFEFQYTLGSNLISLFKAIRINNLEMVAIINQCNAIGTGRQLQVTLGFIDTSLIQVLRDFEKIV